MKEAGDAGIRRALGVSRRSPSASRSRRRPTEFSGSEVERFVRNNASGLTLLGLTLGVFVSRKFLILPVAVTMTVLQDVLVDGLVRLSRKAR